MTTKVILCRKETHQGAAVLPVLSEITPDLIYLLRHIIRPDIRYFVMERATYRAAPRQVRELVRRGCVPELEAAGIEELRYIGIIPRV